MPLKESEAVILRTYPMREADLLVTWDFGYIANVHRQSRVQLFNTIAGFFVPMLVTPEFLINAEF